MAFTYKVCQTCCGPRYNVVSAAFAYPAFQRQGPSPDCIYTNVYAILRHAGRLNAKGRSKGRSMARQKEKFEFISRRAATTDTHAKRRIPSVSSVSAPAPAPAAAAAALQTAYRLPPAAMARNNPRLDLFTEQFPTLLRTWFHVAHVPSRIWIHLGRYYRWKFPHGACIRIYDDLN